MVQTPRSEVIERLIDAAYEGTRSQVEGTTAVEVYSAFMNIALRAMLAAKQTGVDMEGFRDVVMEMYQLLPKGN